MNTGEEPYIIHLVETDFGSAFKGGSPTRTHPGFEDSILIKCVKLFCKHSSINKRVFPLTLMNLYSISECS